jgi:hypothetical protein
MHVVLDLHRAVAAAERWADPSGPVEYRRHDADAAITAATLDWSAPPLARLGELARPTPDPSLAVEIGEVLRTFLERLGARDLLNVLDENLLAMLTVRSAAAELAWLPWELVPSRSRLPLARGSAVVRHEVPGSRTVDEDRAAFGLGRAGAGAILFAWAAPDESVPHTQHRDAIREAIVRARLPPASFEILEEASLPRLRAVLESRRDIRVVHLLAHGRLVDNRSGLVLHGDGARPSVVVSGEELAAVLGPSASRVRLVVLAACGAGDRRVSAVRLGSVAGAIHEAGIEAVIASRFALGKRASVTFSRALYEGVVVEGTSLERAFVRARHAVDERTTSRRRAPPPFRIRA